MPHTKRINVLYVLFLTFVLMLCLTAPGWTGGTSTLTVVDNEPVDLAPGEPGPGDNMIFSVRRNATYVVALSFTTGQPGEIVTHRMNRSGELDLVGRTPGGPEPRAIAMARDGDYAVLVNSTVNEVAVMSIGDDGLLREISRHSSGGLNPYDVAVGYNDIVVIANRDSNNITTSRIDRRGKLTPVDTQPTGLGPHVLVSSRGFVAVANQTERSVSLYELDRRGYSFPLPQGPIPMTDPANPAARLTPRTLTFWGRNLFVALDSPGTTEDVIRAFHVGRNGEVVFLGDTNAGWFLTDIEANEDGLFASTVNINGPGSADDRNEVRGYRYGRIGEGTVLALDASVQTDAQPPSFTQISTGRGRLPHERYVVVSEFQSGWLRSLLYDRRPR